ncbi:MAG: hypothetical protein ACK5WS_06450 [Alphaproteobacteria bacterium]|jgi:hypothetical protein|nr:hypothetical protein [Candidatus Jidaibacter sp.]
MLKDNNTQDPHMLILLLITATSCDRIYEITHHSLGSGLREESEQRYKNAIELDAVSVRAEHKSVCNDIGK